MENKEKVNILLVDDRRENLLALEAVLQLPEYNLVLANSGEEALKEVINREFSVILLDVQMPGLNGFETARLIKSREKSRHVPIIFITAINKAKEHVLNGYAVGAADYIFKPFHPAVLKAKIKEFETIYRYQQQNNRQHDLLKEKNQQLEAAFNELNNITTALQKSEALARITGETSGDTIITFDENGKIINVNPAVAQMFQYAQEELFAQQLTNLLPAVNLSFIISECAGKTIETIGKRKDNTSFPADIQIGMATVEGRPIYVCSCRDITKRKQIEEERFRKIFQSSPCLIAIRSINEGKYIDVNESWLKSTGYGLEEVKSQTTDLLNFKVETDQGDEVVPNLDVKEGINNAKVLYHNKLGEERAGLLSTGVIELQGEKCILSVVTDITERLLLEKKMSMLERLNTIGEMAAGIAHEVRNPMTVVRGFLQLAKENPAKLKPEYLDLMVEELDRANGIISEFLSLAKNKKSIRKMRDINAIIEAIFPLVQAEAFRAGKDITLELGQCPQLTLDEKEIRQLVLNLALNGLEATKPGKGVKIKSYWESNQVVVEVQDQGSGIEKELLEKIWRPFFTTKEKGTGLGLAVCYSIALRHNAIIDIDTNKNGTTFLIRFNL